MVTIRAMYLPSISGSATRISRIEVINIKRSTTQGRALDERGARFSAGLVIQRFRDQRKLHDCVTARRRVMKLIAQSADELNARTIHHPRRPDSFLVLARERAFLVTTK